MQEGMLQGGRASQRCKVQGSWRCMNKECVGTTWSDGEAKEIGSKITRVGDKKGRPTDKVADVKARSG